MREIKLSFKFISYLVSLFSKINSILVHAVYVLEASMLQ